MGANVITVYNATEFDGTLSCLESDYDVIGGVCAIDDDADTLTAARLAGFLTTPQTTNQQTGSASVRSGVVTLTDADSAPIVFARLMPSADYQVLLNSADAPDGLGAWITDQTTAGCTVNLPDVTILTITYLAIADI
jgi:hypothetical protein